MSETTSPENSSRINLVAGVVTAYVSNNHLQGSEIPALIAAVHQAISGLGTAPAAPDSAPRQLTAAEIKRSITPDHIVSFLDGKPYKMLRRHLTSNGLTAEAYRARFGLPVDYPMTAKNYSATRSAISRNIRDGALQQAAE